MKSLLKQLESLKGNVEIEISQRERAFSKRSEAFQDSKEGDDYLYVTQLLNELAESLRHSERDFSRIKK